MIIQKKSVTIEITLETQKEVDMLKDLCRYDVSISNTISKCAGVGREQVELLEYMLTCIRQSL